MNLFKGLLYLLDGGAADPPRHETHYGAATAADTFVRPLGNRAASARWFGPVAAANDEPLPRAACCDWG